MSISGCGTYQNMPNKFINDVFKHENISIDTFQDCVSVLAICVSLWYDVLCFSHALLFTLQSLQ